MIVEIPVATRTREIGFRGLGKLQAGQLVGVNRATRSPWAKSRHEFPWAKSWRDLGPYVSPVAGKKGCPRAAGRVLPPGECIKYFTV